VLVSQPLGQVSDGVSGGRAFLSALGPPACSGHLPTATFAWIGNFPRQWRFHGDWEVELEEIVGCFHVDLTVQP
jgi:hypothetical protein